MDTGVLKTAHNQELREKLSIFLKGSNKKKALIIQIISNGLKMYGKVRNNRLVQHLPKQYTVYVEIFRKFLFSRVSKIAKFKTLVILSILKIYTVVTFAHAY